MNLDRRQVWTSSAFKQAQPGIRGVVIADIQCDGPRCRTRIQRLTPGPRVGDAGPVGRIDQRAEQRERRRGGQPLAAQAQGKPDRQVPTGRIPGDDDLRRIVPLRRAANGRRPAHRLRPPGTDVPARAGSRSRRWACRSIRTDARRSRDGCEPSRSGSRCRAAPTPRPLRRRPPGPRPTPLATGAETCLTRTPGTTGAVRAIT